MQSPSSAYQGVQSPSTSASDYNAIDFMVRQVASGMATAQLVRVKAVSVTGRLTVELMVNQLDGAGNAVPSGSIYDVPYFRLQGGSSGLVIEPVVGDIGVCAFASVDISGVKATGNISNPGSYRRFSYSDGLYLGGFLNADPAQFIRFTGDGIEVTSPAKITETAPEYKVNASTSATISSPSVDLDTQAFGIFGTDPVAKRAVTGALLSVTDPNAKAVLISLIDALAAYGLITKSTT